MLIRSKIRLQPWFWPIPQRKIYSFATYHRNATCEIPRHVLSKAPSPDNSNLSTISVKSVMTASYQSPYPLRP